jgi:hypothetical protein
MINRITLLIAFITGSTFAYSQKAVGCYESHTRCEPSKKEGYSTSGQSKSGTFIPGDTTEVTVTLYKNMDYRISFCSPSPNVDGKVQFQIVEYVTESMYEEVITYEEQYPETEETEETETSEDGEYSEDEEYVEEEYVEPEPIKVPVVTKRKVYKKIPTVTFDNTSAAAGDGFTQEYRTVANSTKTVTIKVFIPGAPEETEGDKKGKTVSYVCVGMLVEHKPAPKLGFK